MIVESRRESNGSRWALRNNEIERERKRKAMCCDGRRFVRDMRAIYFRIVLVSTTEFNTMPTIYQRKKMINLPLVRFLYEVESNNVSFASMRGTYLNAESLRDSFMVIFVIVT